MFSSQELGIAGLGDLTRLLPRRDLPALPRPGMVGLKGFTTTKQQGGGVCAQNPDSPHGEAGVLLL